MSEIKNICFTYITPFHPDRGGIGRVTHSLTLELQRRGYNVFYLIYPCAVTVKHEYNYPAPLEYLPSTECLSKDNIEYYFEYLKRNSIDVVINQSGNFSDSELWCKARQIGIKVVSVLHSTPWVAYQHLWDTDIRPLRSTNWVEYLKRMARVLLYPKIKKRYYEHRVKQFNSLLPNTDRVCLLSSRYYTELSEIVPGYEYKYSAIPNPNSYIEVATDDDCSNKEKILLFVGLFSPPKKEDYVLRLWARVYQDFPEWKLVIVGDGSTNRVNRLKRMARKLDRVTFAGMVPSLEYHKRASILLMTSGYEGWPMVITEAMQCGTVPIAFNSFASISDIIKDGENGVLVTPFCIDEYEHKLRELMISQDKIATMSKAAKDYITRFNVNNVVDKWESLFRTL